MRLSPGQSLHEFQMLLRKEGVVWTQVMKPH